MSSIPHASKRVLHLDITDFFAGMALDFLEELSLRWYSFSQCGLKI